jgi:hypothetical protein
MSPRSRAIVLRRRAPPSPEVLAAELRLAGLLHEVSALDREVDELARELYAFEARYLEATSDAFAELDAAERLRRRVRRIEDELARLLELARHGPPAPVRGARAARRGSARTSATPRGEREPRPPEAGGDAGDAEGAVDGAGSELKTLYRRLARLLHPDLARGDEAERARLSELMARANEAYRRGDRAALELLAERVGAGELAVDVTEAERVAHLARRIAALDVARGSLAAERARLAGSGAGRLRDEAARRAEEGGDLLAEARVAAAAEARAVRDDALAGLDRLAGGARVLSRARREHLGAAPAGRLRAWDPVAESPLVRRAGAARGPRRGSAAARGLADALEAEATAAEPWECALTLLAFFAETAGSPPPPLLAVRDLAERWDALRAAWPGAPDLGAALAASPRHVELGLRTAGEEVVAGLQLSAPDLRAGVREALARAPVAELARRVLAALGPRERCQACACEVYAVHVRRLRGVDEVRGLACPRCARSLKSFWRYGPPEGLEALAPLAVEIGLVVEQGLRVGGAALTFELLPSERARLTSRALLRRFQELCLAPCRVELPRGALAVRAGRRLLPAGARVPEGAVATLVVGPAAGLDERALLRLLRERVKARFRGGHG